MMGETLIRAAGPKPLGILPLVRARGRHGDVGFQVGADRAAQVGHMVETYRRLFHEAGEQLGLSSWADAVRIARHHLSPIQSGLPRYVDEMRGMAEGAGVDFDDILVLNTMEAITSDRLALGCTSLAASPEATAEGTVLVGHNEDWYPADLEDVYLVRAEVEGEPPFLAISYGGLLPNIGFNAAGIAQCCDSVYPTDVRHGIPRILVSRAVLAAGTIDQAMAAALHPNRAAGYNHLLVSARGEILNLEVSATTFEAIAPESGIAVHTNHYQSERMRALEDKGTRLSASRARLAQAEAKLRPRRGSIDRDDLIEVLSHHEGAPYSICCHADDVSSVLDRQQTIASIVMDLTREKMYVAWGNPCRSTYAEYTLGDVVAEGSPGG